MSTQPVEPAQVWLSAEWEALDFRDLPASPLRTIVKAETFARMYGASEQKARRSWTRGAR